MRKIKIAFIIRIVLQTTTTQYQKEKIVFPIRQEIATIKLTSRKRILNGYCDAVNPTDEDILYLLRKVASEEKVNGSEGEISEEALAHDNFKPEFKADMTNECLEYIKYRAKGYKTIILLAMSTESEEKISQIANAKDGLDRQILDSLLESIKQRNDILLIVREHPNRYTSNKYPQPERKHKYDRVEVEKQINSDNRKCIILMLGLKQIRLDC